MRILITNDDGLHASQLVPLIKWWQQHGEVTVFAFEFACRCKGLEFVCRIDGITYDFT